MKDTDDCPVLVVDDDLDIRESLADLLQEQGHATVTAANGVQALRTLEAGTRPCLILLDLMMPVMDGASFRAEQLKNEKIADIPVVLISAFRQLEETGEALGAAGVLKKPIELPALFDDVRRFCRSAGPGPGE